MFPGVWEETFFFSLCIISPDDIIYAHCIQSSLTLKMVSVGQIIYPIGYLPLAAQIQHGSDGTLYLLHGTCSLSVLDGTNTHSVAQTRHTCYAVPTFFLLQHLYLINNAILLTL